MLAIPVDTNGWCVVANEIKDKSKGEIVTIPKSGFAPVSVDS